MDFFKNLRRCSLGLTLSLTACAPAVDVAVKELASETERAAACDDFHEKMRGMTVDLLLERQELPKADEIAQELRDRLRDLDSREADAFIEEFVRTYEVLTTETREALKIETPQEMIAAITALEIGDRSDDVRAELQDRLAKSFARTKQSARMAGLSCAPAPAEDGDVIKDREELDAQEPTEEPTPTPESEEEETQSDPDPVMDPEEDVTPIEPPPVVDTPPPAPPTPATPRFAAKPLPVQGAIRVLTTAYQSCQAGRIPAMNHSTANAQGISIVGRHPNGVGNIRAVSSLSALQRTHYYIREGSEKGTGCFNVPSNPLIYDYGGKPYATSSVTSSLNLFRDSGSGGKVLGIDCSGYVFSALAASGLRLSPNKRLQASLVYGVNARMMMNPESNGLSCMGHVKFRPGERLLSGDILASQGHVVMLDEVGEDPFGINHLRSSMDCVTAKMDHRRFNFDVLQSSPSKNGVGINRMKASDYLDESSGMKTAMIQYAVAACKARFNVTTNTLPSQARLVRHKQTAACKDTPIRLERESCVSSCSVFN